MKISRVSNMHMELTAGQILQKKNTNKLEDTATETIYNDRTTTLLSKKRRG